MSFLGMMIGCNDHVEDITIEQEVPLTQEQQSQNAVMKQIQSILGEMIFNMNARTELIPEESLKFDSDNNTYFFRLLR